MMPIKHRLNRLMPPWPVPVTVRHGGAEGLRLVVDLRCEKFLWRGEHEPHIAQALVDNLHAGDVFWDVGAHIGYFTTQAARLVGPDGRVVAFEPVPVTAARLARGVRLNGLTNVDIVREAVSATAGPMVLHSGGTPATASLQATAAHVIHESVPAGTLDGYLEQRATPTLVKIDVEGYETQVLHGAQQLISACQTAFLVEFTTDELRAEAMQLFDGYAARHLGDRHWLLTTG